MNFSKKCIPRRHSIAGGWLKSMVGVLAALCLMHLNLPASEAVLNPPVPFVRNSNGQPDTTVLNDGAGIIKSRQWAVVLGKALFWDQQAGSDGNACASCHFHAGADTRLTNQLTPGFKDITFGPNGDSNFGSERSDTGAVKLGYMPSGTPAGANYTLTPADMPLHRLVDETNRNSAIITTTNDRISSQGAFDAIFTEVKNKGQKDKCSDLDDSVFHAGPYAARQVEPRNTPSAINAVFFHRNFWDGRANNLFNGVGVFGMRDILGDPNKRLILFDPIANSVDLTYLQLENASLASQAVGPPLSAFEMSCDPRTFAEVGRKLLTTRPLRDQKVDPTDTVLGPYVDKSGKGLASQYLYAELIKKAFDEKYWAATGTWRIVHGQLTEDETGYTQMENNFPMFWGIAITLYESTLVSDQSEYDSSIASGKLTAARSAAGCSASTPDAVDQLLLRGCNLFFRPQGSVGGAGCAFCHREAGAGGTGAGVLFSEAAFQAGQTFNPFLNPVSDVNGVNDLRDLGFANIGLRPVFSDQMSGSEDPYGNPLSFGRQYKNYLAGLPNAVVDPFLQWAIIAGTMPTPAPPPGGRGQFAKLEVDGSSKIPTMRNVALTPPYFSWGGYPSLRQVLKVYNRGMNRRDITSNNADLEAHGSDCTSGDNSGSGPDGDHPWPVGGAPLTATPILPVSSCRWDCLTVMPRSAARRGRRATLGARTLQTTTWPRSSGS